MSNWRTSSPVRIAKTHTHAEDLPVVLYELNENAASVIYGENYERACAILLRARKVLDQLCLGSYRCNAPAALMTFHNLALCYQKLGMLRDCGDSLRQCLELGKAMASSSTKDGNESRAKHMKYLGKVHMQYCAILSQQNKHIEALDHAKYGVKFAHLALQETTRIAESFASRCLNEDRSPSNVGPPQRMDVSLGEFSVSSTHATPDVVCSSSAVEAISAKLLPILNELRTRCVAETSTTHHGHAKSQSVQPNAWSWRKYRHGAAQQVQPHQQPRGRIDMRNLFGFLESNEWVGNLNIGNIMQISPLTLQDVLATCDREIELSRESLLEKIALLTAAYFCVSTEKRFLSQDTGGKEGLEGRQSEFWHGKALELACCFLPPECPLVGHIFSSYQKHHSVLQQSIVRATHGANRVDGGRGNAGQHKGDQAVGREPGAAGVPADRPGRQQVRHESAGESRIRYQLLSSPVSCHIGML